MKTDTRVKRSSVPQYIATLTVDLLALSFGLGIGWTSSAIPLLQSEDTPIDSGPISSQDGSWLAAALCFAAVFATPLYCYCSLWFSRKTLGYFTVAPFVISSLILMFSNSVAMLLTSRVFIGIGSCGAFIFCPIYVSEIAEDSIRGSLGVILMLMRNVGILFAYIIGTYFSFISVAWISLIPPVLFLLLFLWLPETPVYLLRHDRHPEAARALQWLRGQNSDITQELLYLKSSPLSSLNTNYSQTSTISSLKEMFSNRGSLKALVIAVILCINQQVNGYFAIVSYSVSIFQESGSYLSPNTSSIIVGFMLVLGTILSTFVCDRVGRKVLLLVSDILMAISLAALGFYFYFKYKEVELCNFSWLPVTCLSIFVIGLNIGLSPIHMLITTEIFSPHLRSIAVSITGPTAWILSFLVAKLYPDTCYYIGVYGSYWLFSLCCILGTMFIIAVVPETRNRPLQAILEELEGRSISMEHHNNTNTQLYSLTSNQDDEQEKNI